jgi:23S rRNA pseudouridine955/2504/2580 synthase/23S rRNA pseudouridine1911/1915/1917 synthase
VKKNKLHIIYQDEQLLIVDKPSGLVTIPDRLGRDPYSVLGLLQQQFDSVFTVHRLDRETSGVLCFARTESAHRNLSLQFEHHKTDKYYIALVDGSLPQEEGSIDKAIAPHPSIAGKMIAGRTGKPSLTFYQVKERFKRFTLVEALLKTGRTHQIRVHFKSIGHPLAVDALYGHREGLKLSEFKQKSYRTGKFSEEERPLIARTSLHAQRLLIDHPETGERMEFISEIPKDFQAVLNQLRKWGAE